MEYPSIKKRDGPNRPFFMLKFNISSLLLLKQGGYMLAIK